MAWFGVRCVFHWPQRNAYEERITVWEALSAEEAISFAEDEASVYAEDTESEFAGLSQAYLMDGRPTGGAEVFSLIRLSDQKPDAYLNTFFATGDEIT